MMVSRLLAVFPNMNEYLTSPEAIGEWSAALRPYGDEHLHEATTRVISERERPPSIAHVVAASLAVQQADFEARKAARYTREEIDRRHAWMDYDSKVMAGVTDIIPPSGDRPAYAGRDTRQVDS